MAIGRRHPAKGSSRLLSEFGRSRADGLGVSPSWSAFRIVRATGGLAMFAMMPRALALAAALVCGAAQAQPLDKVSFATNWVAQAEHGGFYQALVDGTYRRYGLDVTIVPGGPQVNNRILLPVGKLDFFMSADTLQTLDAVEQNIPTIAVASMFQ